MATASPSTPRLTPLRFLSSLVSWLVAGETLADAAPLRPAADDISFLRWLTASEPLPDTANKRATPEVGAVRWLLTNRNPGDNNSTANKEAS